MSDRGGRGSYRARSYCEYCAAFWLVEPGPYGCPWCDGPLVRCKKGRPVFGDAERTRREAERVAKVVLSPPEPGMTKRQDLYGQALSKRTRRLLSIGDRDNWRCHLCGNLVDPTVSEGPARATLDHVIPRSHRGPNARSNLRLAHADCNSRRGNDPL